MQTVPTASRAMDQRTAEEGAKGRVEQASCPCGKLQKVERKPYGRPHNRVGGKDAQPARRAALDEQSDEDRCRTGD